MIKNFTDKLCVITGGSSGIGLAIAEALACERARLLLVARDTAALQTAAEHLRKLGAAEVQTLGADVSRDDDMARLGPAVAQMSEAADLLVQSAGIVSGGLVHEVPLDEWRRLHDINVLGVVRGIDAVLPAMLARAQRSGEGGHIVNIASAAGLLGFPGLAAYGATKAAVVGLTESLRGEIASSGIGVTAVCPGFVRTPIAGKLQLFGRMNNPRTQRGVQQWFERNKLDADVVARRTLNAIRKNRRLVVVGRDAESGYWTKRVAPGVLERFLSRMTASMGGRRPAASS
jgi:short-subunit dehydrogenase